MSVRDSAGIVLVLNRGPDRPLTWYADSLAIIGSVDEGPDAFARVYPWDIAGDAEGNVYVLDVLEHRIAVFDSTGRHLRDVGREGGGPGEFLQPVGLAVASDGATLVTDARKRSIVGFTAHAVPLDEVRLPQRLIAGRIGVVAERAGSSPPVVALGIGRPNDEMGVMEMAGRELTELAAVRDTGSPHYPGCQITVNWTRPVLAPTARWDARKGLIALSLGTEYIVDLYQGGRLVRSVRRDVPPVRVTRQLALRQPGVRGGFEIHWGMKGCKVSPPDVLKARGRAAETSPIIGVRLAPDASLLVLRRAEASEPDGGHIDVFDPNGRYLGTLPAEFPFPVAFAGSDRMLVFHTDALGVASIRVYRLVRR